MEMNEENDTKELLDRGVEKIIGRDELESKLNSQEPLRIKHGIDPSTDTLHLGHAAIYKKMRQLQQAGHKIIFLIGDFTARFGDPTGKGEVRNLKGHDEVRAKAGNYLEQVHKILDDENTEISYNSEWYDKMNVEGFLKLLSHITHAQLIERDMFQERIKDNKEIRIHEMLYPILQGYDSVMVESDLTIIGSDQLFNEMRGRDLQKEYEQRPQGILSMKLLPGTNGKRKMSQSLGNAISLDAEPTDMFGKIMSIPDEVMIDYFELLTDIPMDEVEEIETELDQGTTNPKEVKMRLATEITKDLYNKEMAQTAKEEFVRVFQQNEDPENIKEVSVKQDKIELIELIKKCGFASSNSEARRLIKQGGVRVNHDKITNIDAEIEAESGTILQVGKKRFAQIE